MGTATDPGGTLVLFENVIDDDAAALPGVIDIITLSMTDEPPGAPPAVDRRHREAASCASLSDASAGSELSHRVESVRFVADSDWAAAAVRFG